MSDDRERLVAIVAGIITNPTSAYALDDDEAQELAEEIANEIIACGWPRRPETFPEPSYERHAGRVAR